MDTTTIILIVLLIVMAAGVAFWYINNQATNLAEAEAEADAARLAAATAAELAAAADADADADAAADAAAETPAGGGTHSLAGDKFIVVKGTKTGVITPETDGKKFTVSTNGTRSDAMVITLEAVEGETETYFLFSKGEKKYMKYDNGGLKFVTKKPTTPKSLKPYKIKFTSIGDVYAMSYMDKDDMELFFGYNGVDKMITDSSVASILSTGLVTLEDAGVSSYILSGNFGEDNFAAFDIALDDEDKPKTSIQGCFDALPDAELGDDVDRDSLLAVAYKASVQKIVNDQPAVDAEENPVMTKACRVYTATGSRITGDGGTGWVTTCVDKTKDIKQGCLL
jgi:Flp pilus assembly protein TadG